MESHDAVIVGARCAGSPLAIELAQRGWDVLLIDRDEFPSDTLSTHLIFPNALAHLQRLGALDVLHESHEPEYFGYRIKCLGLGCEGGFSPIDGFDQASAPRRTVLDAALARRAASVGAHTRFGEKVVGLIGSGTAEDPVAGVVLENGEKIHARWVFGADGRSSVVASELGLEKERPAHGDFSFSYAYWSGIPNNGFCTLHIELDEAVNRYAVGDGLHLLITAANNDMVRGSHEERRAKYLEILGRFGETIEPDVLAEAEMVSDLQAVPESLMRGYFRRATGPGWALVGDAGHFKHPGTAQGIGDALEQAEYVATSLTGDGNLTNYQQWRDARASEHYDWSFTWGSFPQQEAVGPIFRGFEQDERAAQDFRDSFSRLVEPSQVMNAERMTKWFSFAA